MRRAGSKIRVTAELIAPENGEQLWTGRYDRDIDDLFALQDELTTSLSAAIAPEIFRAEASTSARHSDLTAWDRFLKGLSHYYRETKEDFEASIDLFKQAIALDPKLSIARAYLATIMVQGVHYGWMHEQPRIVGRGDGARRKQRPARPALVLCLLDPRLYACDAGTLRSRAGSGQAGSRAEPV